MISKLLVLTLSLVTLSFVNGNAQEAKGCSHCKKDGSVVSKGIPFFKASGTSAISLVGSATLENTLLTFTDHKHIHGGGIESKKHGSEFILDKGSYQIVFTGTFQAITGGDILSLIDVGIKVNSKVIGVNTNNIESDFDSFQILTTSQIIHLKKKSKISIIARNRAPGTSTNVLHRSISIIRLAN